MNPPDEGQIRQWYPQVFRAAVRMTGTVADAADLTQETFLKAIAKWHTYDGRALPTTWLHRILVNSFRDWVRQRAVRLTRPLNEWDIHRVKASGDSAVEHAQREERLKHLRAVVRRLPENLRVAFVATVLDGQSYQGAAELLAVPVGTIASRVNAARQRIRKAMNRAFPEAHRG